MSVDLKTRQRILKVVEAVRTAVAKQHDGGNLKPMASIHPLPAKRNTATTSPEPALAPDKLHLMLPKPHRPIW